jgi:hypothetical protein
MGHVVSCITSDCPCHDKENVWETMIDMLERRKITNLSSGWSMKQSGPCCDYCKLDYSKPMGNMMALAGCRNPFQIAEQSGRTLCQCHIPYREVIAERVNRALDDLIRVAKNRATKEIAPLKETT